MARDLATVVEAMPAVCGGELEIMYAAGDSPTDWSVTAWKPAARILADLLLSYETDLEKRFPEVLRRQWPFGQWRMVKNS
jgi:hypothetical protein